MPDRQPVHLEMPSAHHMLLTFGNFVWPANTKLSGTIPDSLGHLTALTYLGLGEYMLYRYLWI